MNQNLAGALTYDRAKMSDTLFGYQALAGVDYQVSEPLTIGLKFRYADFGEFEDESAYTNSVGMPRWSGIHQDPRSTISERMTFSFGASAST